MMRLCDVVIEMEYHWTGTDGYGGRLDGPQVVTVVGMNPVGIPYPVIISTVDGIRWEVSHTTLNKLWEGDHGDYPHATCGSAGDTASPRVGEE